MPEASSWHLRDNLTALAFFLATAAFTLWQNTRVAVLWDISFFLDTAWRFSLHQVPYTDLPFPYPPLFFFLHTAIIQLFGRVYYPHILCAALEGGLATLLTWRILINLLEPRFDSIGSAVIPALSEAERAESPYSLSANRRWLLAAVLAAPLTVLGIYGIYPHPIYDSDTILAVLLALYLLQRLTTGPARNFLTGAACVLPLFIKQNIGLPFLLITIAAVAAIAITRRVQRLPIAPQLWLITGALTTLAVALLAIQLTVGLHDFLYWTITFAAQRRLPGPAVVLGAYRQTSLLWTIPAASVALVLLRSSKLRTIRWTRPIAALLLTSPFLWTIFSLTQTNSNDASDRADQLLTLWPHLLILSTVLAVYNLRPRNLRTNPTLNIFLPLILLATIHGVFLSQQLWGSTYAMWPLVTLLIAALLLEIPTIALPIAATIAATFLLCGGLYATSHERLSYIQLDGPETHATLPEFRGLTTPGPWIPDFEELIRFTNAEIPANDGILLIPGEVPFYFATGRTPQFPILLFDPATDPYTPQQTLAEARDHNIRWLIVTRNLQLAGPPHPELPEIVRTLQQDFTPYRTLTNYNIYRRK